MDAAQSKWVQRMLVEFGREFRENPRMLKAMAEICIRYRRGNEVEAVDSLKHYLDWRVKQFGNLQDHCISQDLKLLKQLQTNFLQLSPNRLSNGAAILYMSMKDHNPSIYTTADTIKCMHFFIIAAMMVDPELASNGFVFVNDMSHVEYHNLDMAFPGAVSAAIGKSIPVRLANIVITNAPMVVRFVIPIVKAILSTKLLERLHVVEDNALPHLLAIAQKNLPVEMGGIIAFDPEYDISQLLQCDWCV